MSEQDQKKEKGTNKEKKGISIRRVSIIMVVAAVVIVCVLIVLLLRVQDRYQKLQRNIEVYIECLRNAPDLNRASDYLTQQVRSFAATGQKQYLDNYFEEVNVTKRREKALEVLNPYIENTTAFEKMNTAMDASLELMNIEYYSMVLEWEAMDLPDDQLPEELKEVQLSEADRVLTPAKKQEKALSMLFDDTYQSYKSRISDNVEACTSELMQGMEAEQKDSYSTMNKMMITLFGMIILMLLLVVAVVIITFGLVMQPMTKAAEYIRGQQTLPVRGASEMQFLAEAYNLAVEKTQKHHENLQKQAYHDALTGLLNRAGYEKLIAELDEENVCLLLIDVDKFKGVNDTYGHDVGDLVLKKVADILRHQFRANDMIFRFGGDEYAVIMMNAGPQLKDLIKIKIGNANKHLAADDKLPATALSVGAAFGTGTVTDDLFKNADNALYQVKKSGGSGVAFGE